MSNKINTFRELLENDMEEEEYFDIMDQTDGDLIDIILTDGDIEKADNTETSIDNFIDDMDNEIAKIDVEEMENNGMYEPVDFILDEESKDIIDEYLEDEEDVIYNEDGNIIDIMVDSEI